MGDGGRRVLVTGGAGYIGSHTVVELLQAGWDVVVLDNLCNASAESLRRVERITGREVPLARADSATRRVAALCVEALRCGDPLRRAESVGESVARPLEYYDNTCPAP